MTETTGIDLSRIKTRILDTLGVPAGQPWHVAFSGGVDSTVLLHLLRRIAGKTGVRLIALHADHALNPASADWRRHCEQRCREWGIDCRGTKLSYPAHSKLGPEGRAREARYRWFVEQAGEAGWLFTAHHLGDQAETVLERLVRGSGPRGLRGMLPLTRVYGLNVVRPLLDTSRSAIQSYAVHHSLAWITDDSNQDPRFTRNYLRNHVIPVLASRWSKVQAALARTAGRMVEAQRILDQIAAEDLDRLDPQLIRGDPSLDIQALMTLDADRRCNLLRFWVHRESGVSLGAARVGRIAEEIDRYPEKAGGLTWPPVDLRLYRGRLYLLRPHETANRTFAWTLENELVVGDGIVLTSRKVMGQGLKERAVKAGVTVRFRHGGEKCRLPGRAHHHAVKHVLQEAGIPTWQRSRIPLIMVGDEIAAIAGLTYCEPYLAGPDQSGVEIDVAYR